MRRTRDQGMVTSVISLGFLANKLELLLSSGQNESLPVGVDTSILREWQSVLEDTIEFIITPDTENTGVQARKARFLSRAQYLEQIYTATPQNNKKSLKALAEYLRSMNESIARLCRDKHIEEAERRTLCDFAESVGNEAIKEASKFHREPHFHKELRPHVAVRLNAETE